MSLLDSLRQALHPRFPTVSATEAATLIDRGALLVDVRDRVEWRAGHAPQARHVPLGTLRDRLQDLPQDRTLVVVCRSGMRSSRAASLLAGAGRDVVNLGGGMQSWRSSGLPLVAAGGKRGRVV